MTAVRDPGGARHIHDKPLGGADHIESTGQNPTPSSHSGASLIPRYAGSGNDKEDVIMVTFEPNDPTNPMNWTRRKKWQNTVMLCLVCLFIGLATAGYSSGITSMTGELGVSNEVGQVGLFVFNAAFAVVPMFLGPLSEFIGRRPIYIGSYLLFTIWFIPLATGHNIQTIIVARFLSGCSGAAGTTIVPGTQTDIWSTEERGLPVALFSLTAVLGTVAAPLYSGYINQYAGWRWIEWVQLIVNGCLFVVAFFLLDETRGARILEKHAQKLRRDTGDNRYRAPSELAKPSIGALLYASTTRAFILLVREPVVLAFSLWLAFAWAIIFLFFSVIPLTFQGNHGWSQGNAGLPYISSILGCFFAFVASIRQNRVYDRATKRNGGVPVPEARLAWSRVGAVLLPVSLFWFSWTQFREVPWIVPTLALCPMIFSIYLIFDAVQNYLADAYGEYASSAISAQGFVRNMLAASFPLYGRQMFQNLHYQWAGTLCALIGVVMIPLPFVLMKYGYRIRQKSPYAKATTENAHSRKIMPGEERATPEKLGPDIETVPRMHPDITTPGVADDNNEWRPVTHDPESRSEGQLV